jgi:transposase InsO family protein
LAEGGIGPSVGNVGDSYGNALAETIIGLYKTEIIHQRGSWRHLEAVEYAAWNGTIGSIIAGWWNRSATCRRRSWSRRTIASVTSGLSQPDSTQTVS